MTWVGWLLGIGVVTWILIASTRRSSRNSVVSDGGVDVVLSVVEAVVDAVSDIDIDLD